MPDAEEKPRWYEHNRLYGAIVMAIGIAMCFTPQTAPVAGTVITAGAGAFIGGATKAVVTALRKK